MEHLAVSRAIRFLIPQLFTGARIVMAGIALFQAMAGQVYWAATWITYGAITDGLDGIAARRLMATSDFGALFDLFADYLCYVVAPVALSLEFFEKDSGIIVFAILGLPLLSGAIRYARNLGWSKTQSFELAGIPGLGTVVYAFLSVTLVFSRAEEVIGISILRGLILILVPVLSAFMVMPIRYSKIMKYRWIFFPAMAGFLIMPFAFTRLFSTITLLLGFIYFLISPFFACRRRNRKAG